MWYRWCRTARLFGTKSPGHVNLVNWRLMDEEFAFMTRGRCIKTGFLSISWLVVTDEITIKIQNWSAAFVGIFFFRCFFGGDPAGFGGLACAAES